ncbi:MAG: hypothetical protein RLZZ623_2760 [Actinomycetota bacterium]|jgi:DNA-binding NarL/FixJ family response regulator
MIRVLLVDDHAMVRRGIEQFVGLADDMEVVGAAANGREAVDLAAELKPDVILMDLLMPIMDGVAATVAIKARQSDITIIALTTSDDQRLVAAALDAGADGYLMKDIEPAVLLASVRSAVLGGVPMSPSVTASLLGRESTLRTPSVSVTLTPREEEVLRHITAGATNKQIAASLDISEKTVKTHCSHLFQRIGVTDRTHAAAWARRHLPA